MRNAGIHLRWFMTLQSRIFITRMILAAPWFLSGGLFFFQPANAARRAAFWLLPFRITADAWRSDPLPVLVIWILSVGGLAAYVWIAFVANKRRSPALALVADGWITVGAFLCFLAFTIMGYIGFRQT